MRRNLITRLACALAVLLVVPSIAAALDLISAGGFTFDLEEDHNGTIGDGEIDAYDTCYYLRVNGTIYDAGGVAPVISPDGRFVDMAADTIDGLTVERHAYVPAGGGDYIRFVDVITNPGAADATVSVEIYGNLGSDTSTVVTGSSSGDTLVTTADGWFSTDDSSDGSGDTSLAHVFQWPEAPLTATSVSVTSDDDISWTFDATVPAGGRVAFVTFAVQAMDRAASIAEAARIATLPDDALLGLEAFADALVNIPLTGAPYVIFDAPEAVDEGAEVVVTIDVRDVDEGDTPSWSWDLDGDGTFGELPDTATYTIPAGTTDGDGEVRLAVQTSDGTNTRVATRTIEVVNVAPTITSEPPTSASGTAYRYAVEVDEPGGANDPLTFRLGGSVPPGMSIDADGVITWTPPPSTRGRTFSAVVRVLDGDHGQDVQTWDLVVGPNAAPEPPTPSSPLGFATVSPESPVTLVAQNGSDPDGDPLTYFFEVSPRSSFSGDNILGSGETPEADGETSWSTPGPLAEGAWYWRVWVSDGTARSVERYGSFLVAATESPPPDAGPPPQDAGSDAGSIVHTQPSGGCSVGASPADRSTTGLALVAIAALFVVRRRRETNR